MPYRQLLTNEERQALLGIPPDPDGMARRFTLSHADRNLVADRSRDANRIGFAVQLAPLRYPGMALAQLAQPVEPLSGLPSSWRYPPHRSKSMHVAHRR